MDEKAGEKNNNKCIPVQVTPLPKYPVLQAQVNDPGVLVHVAVPDAQFEVPAVHSLMSGQSGKRGKLELV